MHKFEPNGFDIDESKKKNWTKKRTLKKEIKKNWENKNEKKRREGKLQIM